MRVPFDPPPGVFPDDTSLAAAGLYRDGCNVRFHRGRAQLIGGWESVSPDLLSGVCRNVLPWTDDAGELVIAFGTHSALQVMRGGALYAVTPAGLAAGLVDGMGGRGYGTGAFGVGGYGEPSAGDTFPRTWALANWGASLMAAPRGGTVYWWRNATATPAAALAGAPAAVSSMLVTTTRQVMALGCNEALSGTFNPLAIRFTDTETPTGWAITAANLAEEVILEGGGRIVAGKLVGDVVFVWTEVALYQGRFTGDPSQPWRFDLMGRNCGLIGPNAVAVRGQTALWWGTDGQFFACSPDSQPEALACPLQADVKANLAPAQQEKITASTISEFAEVRWDYPDIRDGSPGVENSRYLAVSLADERTPWSRGMMARSAFIDAGPTPSPIGVTPIFGPTNIVPVSEPTVAQLGISGGVAAGTAPASPPFTAAVWLEMAAGGEDYAYLSVPSLTASRTYRLSVYVEMADGVTPRHSTNTSDPASDFAFVAEASTGPVNASSITYELTTGNVWRVSVTFTTDSALSNQFVGIYRTPTQATKSLKFTGWQIEPDKTVTSAYFATTGAAATRSAGQVYYHERGTSADGGPIAWSLTGAAQVAGEGERLVRLHRVWPDFAGQQGAIQLHVGVRDAPQSVSRVKGPFVLIPGQRKRDFRATGRVVEIQLSGSSSPAAWRMGRLMFEAEAEGAR